MTRTHPVRRALSTVALVAVLASSSAIAQGDGAFRFGDYKGEFSGLNEPSAVSIGRDGLIRIADTNNHRIAVFDPKGESAPAATWGQRGDRAGEFRFPEGVAVGPDGLIFVADTGNHRVQVFDLHGGFIRQWGERGAQRGQFNRPAAIAADDLWVYVADTGNDRVQVFERDGKFVTILGGPGALDRPMRRPMGIAVDGERARIAVADTDGNRIILFDRSGRVLGTFGDYGPFAGLLDKPTGLAFVGGKTFVADTRNHRVQIFTEEGRLDREWGEHARIPREGRGRLHYPRQVAVAPDGSFAVIVEPFEDRAQIFRAALPDERESPRMPIPPDEQNHFGRHLAIDGTLLVIPEPETFSAIVFDLRPETPVLITRVGDRGTNFGQFMRLSGVTVDASAKRITLSDISARRLQVFELDYDAEAPVRYQPLMSRFVRAHRLSTDAGVFARATWPMSPEGLNRDRRGITHVVDSRNAMVFTFDAQMAPLGAFGGHPTGPGRLLEPTDSAMNRAGDLMFVVDAGRGDIVAFERNGVVAGRFGGPESAQGELVRPFGIAAGADGFVYVSDTGGHRIVKFTEAGSFVASFGGRGIEHGEFWKPAGIRHLPDGRLVVVDYGNHRAQIIDGEGQWHATFGAGRASVPGRVVPPMRPPTDD